LLKRSIQRSKNLTQILCTYVRSRIPLSLFRELLLKLRDTLPLSGDDVVAVVHRTFKL
jgi:hypothetical protein